jgi:Lipocalin-like domain
MEIDIRLTFDRQRRAKRRSIRPEPYGFSHVYPGRQDVRDDQLQWLKATLCQRLSLAAVEEKAEAFSTFLAYAGRYTLMEDKVIHHAEISSIQNWVDTDLVRLIKFQGDRIILATPPTSINGEIQTWEVVRERVSANS